MSLTQADPNILVAIPYWMQLFAFIAGSIFTLLTILGILNQFLKKPKLRFRLTREIFFRITDFEESIFANGVLIAKNDGILIDEVNFRLNKTDSPTKSFNLKVKYFGEKVRGLGAFADNSFYTSSPISFIPMFMPQRVVYFLTQESYEQGIKKAYEEFRRKILEEHKKIRDSKVEQAQQKTKTSEFISSIYALQNEYCGKIMELVQIEPGKYELEAEILFKTKIFFVFKSNRKSNSKITFKVEDNVKNILRAELMINLQQISVNIIKTENNPVKYPEYNPIEVKEL